MFKKTSSLLIGSVLASVIVITGCNSGSDATQDVSLDTNIDSVSYSLGYQIASMSLKPQGMTDIDTEKLSAGIEAALNDRDSELSGTEMQQIIQTYQMEAQEKAQKQQQEDAEENTRKGEEFLAENREKEGVQETESGLQYEVIEEGTGESPTADDTVLVHYEGTLIDGSVFDSSHERGEPLSIPLSGVIEGWTEGLQLMREGATYKFYIPGNLAYGPNPQPGGPIGPNETLIFEVELIEIQ